MSKTTPTASSSSSSNIRAIIEASLTKYEEETKKDLRTHPLMAKLKPEACKSTAEILAVFRTQVEQFKEFASGDDKLMKSLNPIVNVLCASSPVIGAGIGLVFSPANVIFAAAGVLLSAAKDVIASHDALIVIFERIGHVFNRLEEYTDISKMEVIKSIIVEIMVEVLKIFAVMTKEIKQGRAKRLFKDFFKTLIGRTDIKDALSRLDRLTQEEVKMVIAQVWKATDRIEGGLGTVSDNVDQLIKADQERKAQMEEEKQRQKIEESRRRVREDRRWLSPPDPSTNQNKNIASHAQGKGAAKWFFEGGISTEWKSKSTRSLLWIHGKPGSGKSVLCSAIIKDITALQLNGLATMAYFYFDFKDVNKQSRHNALLSLLTQLSASSGSYCDILSRVYREHNDGTYQPDTEKMVECLKEMLTVPDQPPVYIILDALDECPKTSGVPPARKQVLVLLKDLVDLRLSNLHICVTSRRESDIEAALKRLSFHSFSIQDQSGQKKDIEDYIKSVVYAESDTAMGGWSDEDRGLVIKTLTERADGMFQWVFCQLEVLQGCFEHNIQRTLDDLPDSLDETYERVLREIGKSNRDLALRLLQCLTVAIRPLRVEELTEILALDFDGAEGAIPKAIKGLRSENRQRMVLSTCSSLITIVDDGDSRIIQFSHFSVKEFLTSDRLASSKGDASYFHIVAEPSHTTLAQACLGTLLQHISYDFYNYYQVERSFPFARYASQHLMEHAHFGRVSSRIEDGLRRLFDSAQPYLSTWLRLHNLDDGWQNFGTRNCYGSPLYYALLCGFHDLAESIIVEHPEQVNAIGGNSQCPLAQALYKRHFKVAEMLYQHGAVVDPRGFRNRTPLLAASMEGLVDIVRWLLCHGADADSQNDEEWTPVMVAVSNGHLAVVQTLLEHGVRINASDNNGRTSLHLASYASRVEIVGLLLKHGADTGIRDKDSRTPLHMASYNWTLEVARLLLDYVADIEAEDKDGRTPLHLASLGRAEVVRLLLERGANVNAEDNAGCTPLHLASSKCKLEVVPYCLNTARVQVPRTSQPAEKQTDEIVRMLTEHGAHVLWLEPEYDSYQQFYDSFSLTEQLDSLLDSFWGSAIR